MKKHFKISLLILFISVVNSGFSQAPQAPNVTKSTCDGGFSIIRGMKIKLQNVLRRHSN